MRFAVEVGDHRVTVDVEPLEDEADPAPEDTEPTRPQFGFTRREQA